MKPDLQAYQACLTQCVYYPLPAAGLLRLQGRDRLAFVQRQTTNNTNLLAPGKGQVSVLTSATARILDVFFVFTSAAQAEESLVLLTGKAAEITRYLKSRIFFMDQVSLSDESGAFVQYLLAGPQSGKVLGRLGFDTLPAADGVQVSQAQGQPLTLIGGRGLGGGPDFQLIAPAAARQDVEAGLQAAGALALDEASHAVLRVEAGLPAAGSELSEDYTPLEAGLRYAVSDNKGCYTGQEIIARQITYDKVTRQLAGLRLSQPAAVGSEVLCEDKSVGKITSSAESPRFGPLALAVLKRPCFAPGTQVRVEQTPGSEGQIDGVVVDLPFA